MTFFLRFVIKFIMITERISRPRHYHQAQREGILLGQAMI